MVLIALTSKTEVLQMPSATDVNLGYGFISPIYCSKAKKGDFSSIIKNWIFCMSKFFEKHLLWKHYQMLKDRENFVKAFKEVSNSQK